MANPLTDPNNWIVIGFTLAVVSVCVGIHYEVLSSLSRFLPYVSHQRRQRIIVLILVILITHVVEMWLFAFSFFYLVRFESLGALNGLDGVETVSLLDYAYYSAMVYTTVGFGDIVPTGPIRFMTGMEALTGLVMITWSASFTFLGMQRYWRPD